MHPAFQNDDGTPVLAKIEVVLPPTAVVLPIDDTVFQLHAELDNIGQVNLCNLT